MYRLEHRFTLFLFKASYSACLLFSICLFAAESESPPLSSLVRKLALESNAQERLHILREYADQLTLESQAHVAIPLYEEILASHPKPEEEKLTLIGLARAYTWRENYEEALKINQKVLAIDPHYNQYNFFLTLARDAAAHKKPEIAVEYYQKALTVDPAQKQTLVPEYAKQLSYAYRAQEAIPLYLERLNQNLSAQDKRLTRLDLAQTYVWTKQYPLAIAEYETLLKENPQDIQAREALADVWITFARFDASQSDHTKALNWYLNAISINPNKRTDFLREYADEVSKSGRGPEAVILYKEILASCPSAEEGRLAKLGLAQTYIWLNQHENALTLYDELLLVNPDDPEAKKGEAQVYVDYGRYDAGQGNRSKAIEWFKKAIEVDPEQKAKLAKELADQLRYNSQTEEAIALYKEILSGNPIGEYARTTHLDLAQAYANKFQYDDALKEYDSLLQQNKYDFIAKQGKARVYVEYARYNSRQNKHVDAIDWYTKAIENDPVRQPELLREINKEKRIIEGNKPKETPQQHISTPKPADEYSIESLNIKGETTLDKFSVPTKVLEVTKQPESLPVVRQASEKTSVSTETQAQPHTHEQQPPQKSLEETNKECIQNFSQQAQKLAKTLNVFEANRAFEMGLSLDPNNRDLRTQYAWHLQAFSQTQEYVTQFYLLLPETKKTSDLRLFYGTLGWGLRALGQLDASIWAFSHVYDIPCDFTYQYKFSLIGELFRAEEREKIRGFWDEVYYSCDEEDLEKKKKLFERYTYLGNLKAASSLAEEILPIQPDAYMVQYRYAAFLTQKRLFSAAACHYQQLIDKLPNNAFLYLSLGEVYEEMNCLCAAEIAYETALSLDQNPHTERAYARVLSKLGNCCEANTISDAIPLEENTSLTKYLSAAEVNLNCCEFELAACQYNNILSVYPYNQEALWGLLKSSTYTGNSDDAFISYRRWPKIWFDNPLHNRLAFYYRPPELVLSSEYFQSSTTFKRFSTGAYIDHYAFRNLRLYEGYYYTQFAQRHFKTIHRHSCSLTAEKLFNKHWEARATLIGNYYDKLQHHHHPNRSLYSKALLNYRLHGIYRPNPEWMADIGYDYYDVIDTVPPFGNPIYNYSNQIGAIALNIRTHDVNAFILYSKEKWSAFANFIVGRYSDGNIKQSRSFRADYRFCDIPASSIYYSYFYLNYSKHAPLFTQNCLTEGAYYDPKNFEIHSIGLYTNYDVTEDLRVGGETALLYIPKCRNFAYSAFGYFNYQLACRWSCRLDLRYYYQNQSLQRHIITGYYNAYSGNLQFLYQF